jgi:geranylgeranyl diphosphate synthase type I
MIDDVIAGQMLDVDLMSRSTADEALIRRKMELKTATYTFVRPLQIGLALAGGSEEFEGTLEKFGLSIGLAFQLQDDLLDLTSTEEALGKPAMNDISEGEHTLLSQYFFLHASDEDKEKLSALFGSGELGPDDRALILSMMERAGVVSYAQNELARNFLEGEDIVNASALPEDAKAVLLGLVSYIKERKT